jgi:excisionase family DNA binding protein
MSRSKCCFGKERRELMELRTRQLRRALDPLREALEYHRRSLEGLESALIEFEDALTEPQ